MKFCIPLSRHSQAGQPPEHTFWADLTLGVATTKATLTAGLMWGTGCPVARLIARASSRNAGFCPDSSAIDDPIMLHCRLACKTQRGRYVGQHQSSAVPARWKQTAQAQATVACSPGDHQAPKSAIREACQRHSRRIRT